MLFLLAYYLYGLTFLIDIKINFLTTAFVLNIIFCIFYKKKPLCLNYTNEFKYFIITVIFFFILTCLSTIIAGGSLSEYKSRIISPILGLLIFLILPVNKNVYFYYFFLCYSFIYQCFICYLSILSRRFGQTYRIF